MSKRKVKALPPVIPEEIATDSQGSEPDGFAGSGEVIPKSVDEQDLKSQREKKLEARKREALESEVNYIFDEHKKLCSDIEAALRGIDSIIRRMNALKQRMGDSDVDALRLPRRLGFDQLFNDMRVASQRVGKSRNLSVFLNVSRRESSVRDALDEPVTFD